jgi:sigma-B regulation protein RsbU (phosphoserine phosphatase)
VSEQGALPDTGDNRAMDPGYTARILVVDADEDSALLFNQRFREAVRTGKYALVFAHHGAQALACLEDTDHPVDLMLTDINIPGVSGLELMSTVRDRGLGCKAILVTSYGDTDNIRLAMNHGACDFCTRPLDFQDLERAMDRALAVLAQERSARKNRDDLQGIRQELEVSSRLQQSILPRVFPDHPAVDLYACMTAAKDIGGDLYDFFWLDENRLGFAIADVSGKNISAALYMAITRTLIKSMAFLEPEPDACLMRANRALAQDNDACMFATAFYGVLDIRTGHMAYANAGHCAPLWLRGNGTVETPGEGRQGLALGLTEDNPLQKESVTFAPGERFLLFTDGVLEAFSPQDEEYGGERTKRSALAHASGGSMPWVQGVVADVNAFMDTAPQSDDLTVLGFHFRGVSS